MDTMNADWVQLLMNPQAVRRLYRATPQLTDLQGMLLHRDGPKLVLTAGLERFPDLASQHWKPGCDRLQIALRFFPVHNLAVSGALTTGRLTSTSITRADDRIDFALASAHFSIAGTSEIVDVVHVLASRRDS